MKIICNTGTQPIAEDHSEAQASANMKQFLQEVGIGKIVKTAHPLDGEDGRYCFQILYNNGAVTVWMPGCAIDKLASGDPFDCYRLYLDGSIWLWSIGVEIARSHLESPPWMDEPLVDRRQSYLLQAGYLPSGTTTHCCGSVIEESWSHPLINSVHSFSYEHGSKFVSVPDDDNL